MYIQLRVAFLLRVFLDSATQKVSFFREKGLRNMFQNSLIVFQFYFLRCHNLNRVFTKLLEGTAIDWLIPTSFCKSSILPYLTHFHLEWHNCRSSYSRKIEQIQERALRAVFNSHSELYENLLAHAELPSLLNRRFQDIAILMHRVKYGITPSIVDELFKQKSISYSLRNSNFEIPTFN